MNHITALYISIILAANTVIAEDHYKRAPSGFTGVRGKKYILDSAYDSNVENSENPGTLLKPEDYLVAVSDQDNGLIEKRIPWGFMLMQGKQSFTYVQPLERANLDALYKRAPSGIMGMRGKKDKSKFIGYDLHRIPSGFMEMRNKKELNQPKFRRYYSDERAMSFLGVRDKKVYKDSLVINDNKRGGPSGFFGMRGKKHPSGFFGVRGKKYPYEFRGKFVGVRGKKISDKIAGPTHYAILNLKKWTEKLNINQLLLLLTDQNKADTSWKKNSNDLTSHQ